MFEYKKLHRTLYAFVFLLYVISPVVSYGQTPTNDASIVVSPKYAHITEKLTAELRTSALELQNSLIIWSLDTAVISRGIGAKSIVFTLNDTRKHELTATVTDQDGYSVKIKQTVRASDIDILWEGVSYTPAIYKGRTLYSDGGKVRVAAIPHTEDNKAPSEYVYTWIQDEKALTRASGLGKASVTIDTPPFGDSFLLRVEVETLQGEYVGGTGIRIKPSPVTVILFEQKALLGLWTNTNLTNTPLLGGEVTIRAIPFYMDINTLSDTAVKFQWSAQGATVAQGPNGKAVVTSSKGIPQITVVATNKNKLLQQGSTREIIGSTEGRSLFGL